MKQFNWNIKITFVILFSIGLLFASCDRDDKPGYKGDNRVSLSFKNEAVKEKATLQVGVTKELSIDVLFTNKVDSDTEVQLDIPMEYNEYINIEPVTATVSKGMRSTTFKLSLSGLNLESAIDVAIGVNIAPEESKYVKSEPIHLVVTPSDELPVLDKAQVALLVQYKKDYKLDLVPLIGKWVCAGNLKSPDGMYTYFDERREVTVNNEVMIISLSPRATKDKPILRMTKNALGLTPFLSDMWENLTIKNVEGWAHPEWAPLANKKMAELIGWSTTSEETFDVAMDFEIDPKTQEMKVLTTYKELLSRVPMLNGDHDLMYYDEDDEARVIIPFEFDFSPWNRLLTKVEENSYPDLKSDIMYSGVAPYQILFEYDAIKDNWKEDVEPGEDTLFRDPVFDLDIQSGTLKVIVSYSNTAYYNGYTLIDINCIKQ